jgi:L-fucose mutarotase
MLKGLDPLVSPDLLHILAAMGHGDTIALVDANFPAASKARRLVVLPGIDVTAATRAVLSLLPLDSFVDNPSSTMQVVGDVASVPPAVAELAALVTAEGAPAPAAIERFAFYGDAEAAFAIVQTGERRLYGNIILRKGVIG